MLGGLVKEWGKGLVLVKTYDWDDFVLDGPRERYYVEEAGEIELGIKV